MLRNTLTRSFQAGGARYYSSVSAEHASVFSKPIEAYREDGKVTVLGLPTNSSLASVTLRVESGSRFETEENNGAANFLKHLAFTGKTSSGSTISQSLSKIGAVVNVSNCREQTSFTVTVDSNDVNNAVSILGEMVSSLKNVTAEQVDAVRPRVRSEKRVAVNNYSTRSMDHLHSIVYQQDAMGLSKEGSESNIQSLSAKTISQFAAQSFTNDRMSLGVSGNVSSSSVFNCAKTSFPGSSTSNIHSSTPRYFGSFVSDREDSPNDDVTVTLAYETVPYIHNDFFPLLVVKSLIGDFTKYSGASNNHSGNFAEFVATEKLCDGFKTFNLGYSDAGLFGIMFYSQGKYLDDLVNGGCSEFVRLAHNARPLEVERAKTALKNEILKNTSPDSISDTLARFALFGSEPPTIEEAIRQVDSINENTIREVCRKRFMDVEPALVGVGSTQKLPDYNRLRGWTQWRTI